MDAYGMKEFELVKKADVMRIINAENAVVLNNLKERSADEVLCAIASQINSLQTTAKSGSLLIDRQALINDMCNNKTSVKCPCYPNCYPCDFSEARRIIDIQPTIKPEVRHGRWIEDHMDLICTVCKWKYSGELPFMSNHGSDSMAEAFAYCPHCGAPMDGDADNG